MDNIFSQIRSCGGRITKTRKEILHLLNKTSCLISQANLLNRLSQIGLKPNRSTVYRELLFLIKNGIVIKNTINGVDYYEIPTHHHHHVVCLKCNLIQKIDMEDNLKKEEISIGKYTDFHIISHSLEFYGYCKKCKL